MVETTEETAQMMTIDEVAEYLQLHPLTVRRLAREGSIPAFKVGRQWRVKRALLDAWVTEQSTQNIDPQT
jgi:excisionase family DNA binding protein